MLRIHQLPPGVVARIAAGEVVERPASVVKELLENSLDAGSRRVDIELEAGGTELIRIVDDGHGIDPDDLALAFAPHATSKLATADDLFAIGTLGFRGEALASVGGIAQVLLQSRRPGATRGAEIRCDGGTLSETRPWNGSPGTRIEVRHLFYSVPVRKKFLKALATEFGHVCEAVTRIALAHPGLHLTLKHNGKTVYDIPAAATLADRIGLFFGNEIRESLYEVASPPGPHQVFGFIADPKCDRGNAKLQYFFVNGRWFRDRSLSYALQDAYRGLIMVGRHPVGFLFLNVPPATVDVNVHPAKAEVRFRDNAAIFSLVRGTVKQRLLYENLIPQLEAPPEPPPERTAFVPIQRDEHAYLPFQATVYEPRPAPPAMLAPTAPAPEPPAATAEPFPLPPPGTALQVHDAYLILETPQGMLVIDQHALHERILYEQLRRRVQAGKLEVQRLLIPEPIDLPAEQLAQVLACQDALATLGLEVSEFGGNTILLSSYPTLLGRRRPHEILAGVIDQLLTNDRPPSKEAMLDHLMATMACKAAVKAGDKLTPEEIAYLLELRLMAEDSHHCPHGRPTSLIFTRQELDRQFRRI